MVIYAAFGWRVLAYLIDSLVVGAIQMGFYVFAFVGPGQGNAKAVTASYGVAAALTWAYFALLESSPMQATLGKLAIGLRVEHVDGGPLTFRRASVRYWAKMVSTLVFGIGWLFPIFTPRRQALHDMIAKSAVVKALPRPVITNEPVGHWDPGVPQLAEYWDGSGWSPGPGR